MRQYEMFELTLKGSEPMGSPALVKPEAGFALNGESRRIQGFYAGNGEYKFRFYPQQEGICTWTVSEIAEDGKNVVTLTGPLSGQEQVLPAAEGCHGMVRAKGLNFVFEDGSRYLAVGTTVYAMVHQEKALIEQTFETLEAAPFNKVRFCLFPKHYDYNRNEPDYFAFDKTGERFDVNRPCYPFWEALEKYIDRMDRLGIQGDLILFHPYDRWGFSRLSREECLIYLDYLVRRLSAYPNLWWSLANEYDLMEHFGRGWWAEFARFLHDKDPYGHLLSNHNCLPYWDFSDENTTHCCIQDFCVGRTAAFRERYGKPVVIDECCYEGNIEHAWGNISAFEMVHRFWTVFTLGGYCTHGETYLDENEVLWWAKGGRLHGESPARIAFLRDFMEGLPGDLEPVTGFWASFQHGGRHSADMNVFERGVMEIPEERLLRFADTQDAVQSHCGKEVYLRYYGRQCTAKGSFELPEDRLYDIQVIDVWEMTCDTVLSGVHGKVDFPLPGREGIAAAARVASGVNLP